MATLTTRVNGRKVVLYQEHYDGPFTITVDQEPGRVYRISYSSVNHPISAMTQVMGYIAEGII